MAVPLLLRLATVKGGGVVTQLLERLGQRVGTLLLVDENDNRRLEAALQHLQQLVPVQSPTSNQRTVRI